MRILIFGAGGQVGRALAASAPKGASLATLDRTGCDIGDRGAVEQAVAAAAPDLIINAAAYTAVDRGESEVEAAERLNATAPGWIAAASRAASARFVHVSTDFVFDGRAGSPYRPDAATNPQSVYGRTKRDGELAVMAAFPCGLWRRARLTASTISPMRAWRVGTTSPSPSMRKAGTSACLTGGWTSFPYRLRTTRRPPIGPLSRCWTSPPPGARLARPPRIGA